MSETLPEPLVALAPFKYLTNPEEWQRDTPDRCIPNEGDFVVLSMDPLASVAHLDHIARRAARGIPVRKYIALILRGFGLPLESKPTNAYDVIFVRQGMPRSRALFDTVDMCLPIWPNSIHSQAREPLRPAQPLPWPDCYVDTTSYFPIGCRITTAERDYTPVLPISDTELTRVRFCAEDDGNERRELEYRVTLGSLEAIACVPLPPSPASATLVPLPPSPQSPNAPSHTISTGHGAGRSVDNDSICSHSDTSGDKAPDSPKQSISDVDSKSAEVSIIASEDGNGELGHVTDDNIDTFMAFEDMINTTGDILDPVVNVWYDINMVSHVVDPILFIEELDKIRRIIDEAEIRLGIKPDHSLPQGQSESASRPLSPLAPRSRAESQEPSPAPFLKLPAARNSPRSRSTHRRNPHMRIVRRIVQHLKRSSSRIRVKVQRLTRKIVNIWTCRSNALVDK